MPIGSSSIIEFDEYGKSVQQIDPFDIVFEKIKFLLLTNKNEILGSPDYGGDLTYYKHRLMKNSSKDTLKKSVALILNNNMPYVILHDIIDIKAEDNVLGLNLVVGINEDLFNIEVTI